MSNIFSSQLVEELLVNAKIPAENFRKNIEHKQNVETRPNLFSIISSIYHRENLHSDVLAYFLDPKKGHKCGFTFLYAFINMLNNNAPQLQFAKHERLEVYREKGRIDISILDPLSKRAIIIENKINNAKDQHRQLYRYIEHLHSRDFTSAAIVYLSLDGSKRPSYECYVPEEVKEITAILLCLAAAHPTQCNLVRDWLSPCMLMTNDLDVLSTLRQYSHLLQLLNKSAMDFETLEQFYRVVGRNPETFQTALTLQDMMKELPYYMAERLKGLLEASARDAFPTVRIHEEDDEFPFVVCEGFTLAPDFNFTIDVQVLPDVYEVTLFERRGKLSIANDPIKKVIEDLKLTDKLSFSSDHERYLIRFSIPDGEQDMIQMLKSIFSYLKAKVQRA
jgi:hypothetical protein